MNNTTGTEQIAELSPNATTTCGFIMLCVFIFSIAMTSSVAWALWKSGQLEKPVYRVVWYLLLNEVLVRVLGSPMIVTSLLSGRWLYGDIGCTLYAFWMTFLGIAATSLFTCVAIERYIIVCRVNLVPKLTKKRVDVMCILCYVHGLLWAMLPLLGINEYVYEPSRVSCTPNWSHDDIGYIYGLFIVCFLMPVAVSSVCYSLVYIMVRSTGQNSTVRHHSVDRNVALSLFITMVAFLIAWTPYSVIALLSAFGFAEVLDITKELTLIPLVTAKSAGLLYPLIFYFNNRKIRGILATLMSRIKDGSVGLTRRPNNRVFPLDENQLEDTNQPKQISDIRQKELRFVYVIRTSSERLEPRPAIVGGSTSRLPSSRPNVLFKNTTC